MERIRKRKMEDGRRKIEKQKIIEGILKYEI
jgi:hypothetical protein